MNYTVAEIVGSNDWDGGGQPARATTFWTFRQADDQQEYEIGRRPDNPLKVGDSFEAETVGEKFGRIKLKKLQPQSFNGGGKRDEPFKADPARQRSIMRQSAQKAALEYAALQHARGKLPEAFKVSDLGPIVDWFYQDACAATDESPIAPPSTERW